MNQRPLCTVRKAKIKDAAAIHALIKKYAIEYDLVIRTMGDIYTQVRDYFVMECRGKVAGVIALHIYWDDLGEIRSFIIAEKYRKMGFGGALLGTAIREAQLIGIKKIFALTKIPKFFKKYGFNKIAKKALPNKIWKDCFNCPKFPDCDEDALILNLKNSGEIVRNP